MSIEQKRIKLFLMLNRELLLAKSTIETHVELKNRSGPDSSVANVTRIAHSRETSPFIRLSDTFDRKNAGF